MTFIKYSHFNIWDCPIGKRRFGLQQQSKKQIANLIITETVFSRMQQQRSSTDQRWVSYIVILFTYVLAVVTDWLSAIIFMLILLQFAGLINKRWMFFLVELVLITDVVIKSPFVNLDPQKFRLDKHCIQLLFDKHLKPQLFIYAAVHIYNLYLLIYSVMQRNRRIYTKTWGPLMTQVMVYVQPLIMYALSLFTVYQPIRVAWAALACLQVLDVFPILNHFLCCVLITCFFFVPDIGQQYSIKIGNSELHPEESFNIVIVIFVVLLIFLNVYSNSHPNYKQTIKKDLSASINKKVVAKRQLQQQEQKIRLKSKITLIFAVILCLVTTSLGNIFILFSIYFNIPSFKAKRFFFFLGVGTILSIILQPEQIPYFIYLYTIVLVVGQEIASVEIIHYQVHSYSFFLDFYRLYIMLNHVSFLNWLIGLLRSSSVVVVALSVRIFCRYFGYASVFLGTNDDYGLQVMIMQVQFINLHALSDFVLIFYLVLLCLYSPTKTKTYQSSSVTNILLEYPILQKIKKTLIILKFFNWISYIIFSLIILSRKPSLYITIHIFYLVLILICDTMKSQENLYTKNRLLKGLWSINFYITIIMIFTKYFYFLKQYDSNSDLMDYLLGILTTYKGWIGLDQLKQSTEGFALGMYFLYDGTVLILSWINIYVYQFKLYYDTRKTQLNEADYEEQQSMAENHLKMSLLNANQIPNIYNNEPTSPLKKDNYETQQDRITAKYENIHYFYLRFIKPVDLKAYLAQHEYKTTQKILRDCLLDMCFGVIVLAFYLQKSKINYIFYMPHFIISSYAYYQRFTKGLTLQFTRKILGLSTAWSFIILFGSYLYITFLQMYNQDIPSAIIKVYVTYILCIITCLMYKICSYLPNRQSQFKNYHCIIFLCFPFKVESQILWTEILSIFSQFWLAFTMSLFFTGIFSPQLISTFAHPIAVVYLLITKIGRVKPQHWLYIICLLSILDIWNYDFFGYFTILAVTVFYAVKNAQKLSEEEVDNVYRDQFSESESELNLPDIQQEVPDSDEKKWPYYMAYCTIVWFLPQMISLLWMFGVVWLSPSLIATVLILFSYCNLLYQLLAEQTKISPPLFIITLGITILFFCYEIFQYTYRLLIPGLPPYDHSQMGLFLIFGSCFFYFILKKRIAWYTKRSTDAKAYWTEKTELVGQLGSQLHNEKKLITLQRYYSSKEKLTQKVNKISSHIKQSGRKAYFQSLDNILKPKEPEQGTYELYTNMLIFLDMHLLKKCFLMLNQYMTVQKHENVCQKAKFVRAQIYRTYQRSFNEAFSRFKTQRQDDQQPEDDNDKHNTVRSSTVNIQRVNEINLRYKRCFEIITKSTQRFNKVLRLIIQHLQIISMMIVIGWNLFGGVYTIPANLIIFGWAVVLENKTTVTFWIIVMSYACFVLIIKQIIVYLPDVFIINFVFYYHPQDYLYEYFVIMISVIQITVIKLGGTRYQTYSQRESIYDAFYRAALNRAANGSELDKQQDFMGIYKNLSVPSKHSFLYRVFSKSRFKPGKDFYPLMSSVQLFILLYIFFFYDMMELESKKNRKSIGELLTISQFSSHMVIALFLQVMIMIIDRLIVSLNLVDEENQALENFFLSFTFSVTQVKYQAPQKLDKVGIFDFLLVLKYLFHLTLLVLINFFVYFYIPSAGLTKSLIPSCSQSECNKSYTYLSIFLILYFIYFLISGLQIKHGFNRNKCKNVLMQKYHYTNYYTYKAFTAIPFAWEFKKICDWTVTSTALPLFHWMKFQDINARLYQSKCQAEMIKIKPLGTPWNKYFLGPSGFLLILLLVFSPFIVYSSVNPFAVKDAVIGARAQLYLRMNQRYDYKFFLTSHATVTENDLQDFEINLKYQNLFLLKMSKYPDQNFLLSEPIVKKLADKIKQSTVKQTNKFSFVLYLTVLQKQGGQSKIQWSQKILNQKQLQNTYKLLTLQSNNMTIQNFYSPFPGQITSQSITIYTPTQGQYFEIQLSKKSSQNTGNQLYFYFLTSNKFKIGVGVLTFYITYVLVISRLLRFYLTGTVRNILYEGCYLETILVLCEAVRQARIVENFLQQQSFYFELIDIMRQPKALKQITGDFLTFRKKYIKMKNQQLS